MLDLVSAIENFAPEGEAKEASIDRDFITDFLLPYFRDLPREELARKVAEVISLDECQRTCGHRPPSRVVSSSSCRMTRTT